MAAFSQGSLIEQTENIATSGGTTSLSDTNRTWIQFTGSSNQTVVFPNATTLTKGRRFVITNNSTGKLTINTFGGTFLDTLLSGDTKTFFLRDVSTSAGTWLKNKGADQANQPLTARQSFPNADSLLVITANPVESEDGSYRSASPIDGKVPNFSGATIDFSTGAVSGSIVTDNSGSFTLPVAVAGQFRRMTAAYIASTDTVNCTFSSLALSQGALTDAGQLFDSLYGSPLFYVDLEGVSVSEYKTAGTSGSSSIVENKGLVKILAGTGTSLPEIEAFKALSIPSANTLKIRRGFILLSDGRELVTYDGSSDNVDLSFNLKTQVNTSGVTSPSASSAYYLYLDLNYLPGSPSGIGSVNRQAYRVQSGTSGMFTILANIPESSSMSRYVPICVLKTDGSSNYTLFSDLAHRRHDIPTAIPASSTEIEIIEDSLDLPTYSFSPSISDTLITPIYTTEAATFTSKGTKFKQYIRTETIDGLNRIFPGLALPLDDISPTLAWGSNTSGELGVGDVSSRSTPTTQSRAFLGIGKGSNHAVGVNSSGFAFSWGSNTSGQLGTNTVVNTSSPVSVVGGNIFVQIQASGSNTYALDFKGSPWAWGASSGGALGNNQTVANASSPVSVVGDNKFIALAAGKASGGSLALTLDEINRLWSWGANSEGQLGDSTVSSKSSPVLISSTTFKKVTSGFAPSALDFDGFAWSWGLNTSGEIGDNSVANKSSPVSVVGSRSFVDIASGDNHTLALDKFGRVWAWGKNNAGQLGDVTAANKSSPVSVFLDKKIIQIGAFGSTSLAIDIDGRGWAWGSNTTGEIGDGTTLNRSSPVSVTVAARLTTRKVVPKKYVSDLIPMNIPKASVPFIASFVASSSTGGFVLDAQSYAWAWGIGGQGQLGNSQTVNASSPVSVLGGKQWAYLTMVGQPTALALDNNSYAWGWGYGNVGNIGDGTSTSKTSPSSVLGGKQWRSISVSGGGSSNCGSVGLDSLSYAWCWGSNTSGILGDGTATSSSSPVSVIGNRQFIQIVSGLLSTVLARDSLSYAWAWGSNSSGVIGNESPDNSISSPVSVVGGRRWTKIYLNSSGFALALDSNSYAWAWGNNSVGGLGNNSSSNMSSPVSVLGGKQWLELVVTQGSTVIGIDNLSYAWGWGFANGHVGDGTLISRSSPVSVLGNRQWRKINTASGVFVGLDSLSYAWSWGTASGVVGSSSPVSITGGKQWIDVNGFTFLDGSSYAWGWGSGTGGALAQLTSIANQSSPVIIATAINPRKPFGR